MKILTLFFMVAIVCEAIVEYFKSIVKMVENGEYKTAITQGITILLGVGFAFIFHLQLFNDVLVKLYDGIDINPIIDMTLTGILFSRGSNYFSDLVKRLTPNTITARELIDSDEFNPDVLQIKIGDGSDMEEFFSQTKEGE